MVFYNYIQYLYTVIIYYDVNIRCMILITELYRLFDIVTESEPEFTYEIVPAGCTRSNYNYIWSTI